MSRYAHRFGVLCPSVPGRKAEAAAGGKAPPIGRLPVFGPAKFLWAALALGLCGCAATGKTGSADSPAPTSVQTLEYYPYLVKGYQKTFPHRTVLVLLPHDERKTNDAGIAPLDGKPAIGVISDKLETVIQRLYSEALARVVQKAILGSAEEAGLHARAGAEEAYDPEKARGAEDYVLATRITRCWVKKQRGTDSHSGPLWNSTADFALTLTLYKPPFKVPFWVGSTRAEYHDPPLGSFGLDPEENAAIYDQPGEVLSVALTRAVAAIFQHQDLRALIQDDRIASH